jgi:hypothetical protein
MRVLVALLAGCTSADSTMDAALPPDATFTTLFDGATLAGWRMAGVGSFTVEDAALVAQPADGLGLLWSTIPTPPDFLLRLQWKRTAADDNSGVFIRFPDPESKGYDNTAWVAVDWGLEIQIDDTGHPDGAPLHTTGAIYEQPGQQLSLVPSRPVGEWNTYEIEVRGQTYIVRLDGTQVTTLVYGGDATRPDRALPSTAAVPRFIGIQSHTGHPAFRNIEIRAL